MIKVDKTSLMKIEKEFARLKRVANDKFYDEMRNIAARSAEKAQRRVVRKRSELARSIGVAPGPNNKIYIYAKMDYAPYVEFGTGRFVDLSELDHLRIPRAYAEQYRGKGERSVNLPARPFFFNSIREELREGYNRINKMI